MPSTTTTSKISRAGKQPLSSSTPVGKKAVSIVVESKAPNWPAKTKVKHVAAHTSDPVNANMWKTNSITATASGNVIEVIEKEPVKWAAKRAQLVMQCPTCKVLYNACHACQYE